MKTMDMQIKELFEVVQKQKVEVSENQKLTKKSWNTHGSFKLQSATPLNISTATEDQLLKGLTELLAYRMYVDEAQKLLGLSKEIKVDGFSVDEWVEDFQKRIATLQLKAKMDKLKSLEDRLQSIVSPEQKRQMELEAIIKDLQ